MHPHTTDEIVGFAFQGFRVLSVEGSVTVIIYLIVTTDNLQCSGVVLDKCFTKLAFLKITQISQENTCVGVFNT